MYNTPALFFIIVLEEEQMKKHTVLHYAKELSVQIMWEIIGSIFIAIGIYNFAVQAQFPMTGFSGIAIILYRLFHVPMLELSWQEVSCLGM